MTAEINLEDPMKLFYKGLYNLDPDECILVPHPIGNLEIALNGQKRLPLEKDFLLAQAHLQMVAVDQFSTKEVNNEVIATMSASRRIKRYFEQMYIELFRVWGVIDYEDKAVGILDQLNVHSGFPIEINPEDFAKNPQKEFDRAIALMVESDSRNLRPLNTDFFRQNIRLHRDFLREHPIYREGKQIFPAS